MGQRAMGGAIELVPKGDQNVGTIRHWTPPIPQHLIPTRPPEPAGRATPAPSPPARYFQARPRHPVVALLDDRSCSAGLLVGAGQAPRTTRPEAPEPSPFLNQRQIILMHRRHSGSPVAGPRRARPAPAADTDQTDAARRSIPMREPAPAPGHQPAATAQRERERLGGQLHRKLDIRVRRARNTNTRSPSRSYHSKSAQLHPSPTECREALRL